MYVIPLPGVQPYGPPYNPYPYPSPCPGCGRCPACGRSDPRPWVVPYYPWSTPLTPTQPVSITCGSPVATTSVTA